ncbi:MULTISPECIES: hypothetical protein [Niastella]|uniref:Uncharacterized protein n=1 Tax=Niastella soli TaxID=2821487 RepID=A0ABS3YNT6_9BACT|nr:hypothetical protein [Niastella soli]MBO9199548.1 hypothetical protein [Niastella soli]
MKLTLLAVMLFLSLTAGAQKVLLKNESEIFSFDTQSGKHVVLAKDKDNAYIVYRFGAKDSVEFECPEKNRDSWKKFKYSFYLRGGGVQNEGMDLNNVYFINNGYKYSIYDNYYSVGNKSQVGIRVTNLKTNRIVNIKGIGKTRKGTMIDFRVNKLLEIEELDE